MKYDYDVLVIGSGPAGESAAINATKHGKKVVVIESESLIGGNCTHKGTIPSKALRHVVRQIMRVNRHAVLRNNVEKNFLTYPDLLSHAEVVINRQVALKSRFYQRNRIEVISGFAKLIDKHTVEVKLNKYSNESSSKKVLSAKNIIVATGSSPYRPPSIDFNHHRVYDSDTILNMQHTPKKIIVFGAGVIGCEYASIFCNIGIKVDLIDTRHRLMEFLDDEISDALSYHLRTSGVMIRHNEQLESFKGFGDHVEVTLKSGKIIKADALLWCNGRSGNTQDLGLEDVGVEMNDRAQIITDERYRTSVESIYAAGDVIGWPSLASAAYDQGRSASAAIRGKEDVRFVDDVPTGIYTLPEISSVGATEQELTQKSIPYEVGKASLKDTARGQISGETVGVLKILFHSETLQILGVHCFGAEASEIIHIGQAIMNQPGELNTIRYFTRTTFNFPTTAEAYRNAALNGLNRINKINDE